MGLRKFTNHRRATEIKKDGIKGNTRSKRISDIRKLWIKFLKSSTDLRGNGVRSLLMTIK